MSRVILSCGGGMESTATLALTLYDDRFKSIRPEVVLFCDLGHEWSETYTQIEFIKAICAKEGIQFVTITPEVHRGKRKFGEQRTWTDIYTFHVDYQVVPGISQKGRRLCTELFKIAPIQKYLKERYPGEELTILIGFGSDEKNRIKRGENTVPGWTNRFPLDEADMCRCKSIEYMRSIDWPVPRRSGCTFCPFSKRMDIEVQREVYPAAFQKTLALEQANRRYNDPVSPFYLFGDKPVEKWLASRRVKRVRKCKGCGKVVDLSLHVFGDTDLRQKFAEMRAREASA